MFLCNHEVEVGEPETADEELDEDCRVDFQWSTKLACPPHDQVTYIDLIFKAIDVHHILKYKFCTVGYP